MSDKLLISLMGITVNADGTFAVGAAVVIVVAALVLLRGRRAM